MRSRQSIVVEQKRFDRGPGCAGVVVDGVREVDKGHAEEGRLAVLRPVHAEEGFGVVNAQRLESPTLPTRNALGRGLGNQTVWRGNALTEEVGSHEFDSCLDESARSRVTTPVSELRLNGEEVDETDRAQQVRVHDDETGRHAIAVSHHLVQDHIAPTDWTHGVLPEFSDDMTVLCEPALVHVDEVRQRVSVQARCDIDTDDRGHGLNQRRMRSMRALYMQPASGWRTPSARGTYEEVENHA